MSIKVSEALRLAMHAEVEDLDRLVASWAQSSNVPRSARQQHLAREAAARAIGAQDALLWLMGGHDRKPGDAVRVAFGLAKVYQPARRLPALPPAPVLSAGWDGQPELLAQHILAELQEHDNAEADPMCVCDHPLSQHALDGLGACQASACACGPGCIHDGFVNKDTGEGVPDSHPALAKQRGDFHHGP